MAQRLISISRLKNLAVEMLPSNSILRKLILSEPDENVARRAIGKDRNILEAVAREMGAEVVAGLVLPR